MKILRFVFVKVGTTIIGRGKTDTAGNFSVVVPIQEESTKLGIIVRDGGGNYSPYTVKFVE